MERTGKLLVAFRAREAAVAAAEQRSQALADRIAAAEAAAAKRHKSLSARLAQAEAALRRNEEELNSTRFELQDERKKRRAAEAAKGQALSYFAALHRKADEAKTAPCEAPVPVLQLPADTLLADTISF